MFKRADHAEQKALEWIEKSNQIPLYLCGDSGSGKSSLLIQSARYIRQRIGPFDRATAPRLAGYSQ
jgi:hypothetical protein